MKPARVGVMFLAIGPRLSQQTFTRVTETSYDDPSADTVLRIETTVNAGLREVAPAFGTVDSLRSFAALVIDFWMGRGAKAHSKCIRKPRSRRSQQSEMRC
jgi:hypothetical protein